MAIDSKKDERLAIIARQISGKLRASDELIPEVAIKGTGDMVCWSPGKRCFIKIARGQGAYVVDGKQNEYGRVMIYTHSGHIVEIEPKELIDIGYD